MYSFYINLWPITCSLFLILIGFCMSWMTLRKDVFFYWLFYSSYHLLSYLSPFPIGRKCKTTWNLGAHPVLPKINQCASTLVFAPIRHQFIRTCALVFTSIFTNLEWNFLKIERYWNVGFIAIRDFSFYGESDFWSDIWLAMNRVVCLSSRYSFRKRSDGFKYKLHWSHEWRRNSFKHCFKIGTRAKFATHSR